MKDKYILIAIKILWTVSALIILSLATSQLEGMGWFGAIVLGVFFYGGFVLLANRAK